MRDRGAIDAELDAALGGYMAAQDERTYSAGIARRSSALTTQTEIEGAGCASLLKWTPCVGPLESIS